MAQYKGYWVSAFQEDQDVKLRYHPVVGCGEYYAGGIDQAEIESLAPQVFDQLADRLGCRLTPGQLGFCQYDGWVAEAYVEPGWMCWRDLTAELEQLQDELAELHLSYIAWE